MVNMDLARLTQRRETLRRKKRIRQTICNIIAYAVVASVMAVGMHLFFNMWEQEIDAHAESNRQFIQEINMERMSKGAYPIQ